MGKKRKMPGLNTSSTADISFMLLIFFLVTTSMDTDQGLGRTLPKPPEDDQLNNEIKVKDRNILNIRINKDNEVQVQVGNGNTPEAMNDREIYFTASPVPTSMKPMISDFDLDLIKEAAKKFIANKDHKSYLPEVVQLNVDLIGKHDVTENHVISVQTDEGTSYGVYFQVQDALVAAYNELRNELSKEQFGFLYANLTKEQQDAIRKVYPQKISEAEPKQYGKQQ